MAEGFIVSVADERKSLIEYGEEYFLTLLQRGFFQDVEKDKWGSIMSCKMHDLMHDLAQEVAGLKCKVIKDDEVHNQNNMRHLSIAYRLNFERTIPLAMLKMNLLRTLLLPQQQSDGSTFSKFICLQIISSFKYLRVLDLHGLGLIDLPTSIGKLIHLRYLNLSTNPIRALPDSISEFYNLQTLLLKDCKNLIQLPTNISNLIKLRSLDIRGCDSLDHIPLGIGELTLLHKLPRFIVNHSTKLSDLKNLNNLRGHLGIEISENPENAMLQAREVNLTCKHGLTELCIAFLSGGNSSSDHDEVVLEGLKPHPNLRSLAIFYYKGHKLPSWTAMDSLLLTLPKLVEIRLFGWSSCQKLPVFCQLPLLRVIILDELDSVEYIEEEENFDNLSFSRKPLLFFQSLKKLELSNMWNLKAWKYELGSSSFSFPELLTLKIENCPNMTSLPSCPNVEEVCLENFNKELSVLKLLETSSKLKKLRIDNVEDLLSMSKQCLHQISSLQIWNSKLVNSSELGNFFATLSSSLRSLKFGFCQNLRSISKGLENLTALEELTFSHCKNLDLSLKEHMQQKDEESELSATKETKDGDGRNDMPWKAFKTSFRSLRLTKIPKLVNLPSELQYLNNLRTLEIQGTGLRELPEWISRFSLLVSLKLIHCEKLKSLPEGFRKLIALQELHIKGCSELTERCKGPNGDDWHKIQHISLVVVEEYLIN